VFFVAERAGSCDCTYQKQGKDKTKPISSLTKRKKSGNENDKPFNPHTEAAHPVRRLFKMTKKTKLESKKKHECQAYTVDNKTTCISGV